VRKEPPAFKQRADLWKVFEVCPGNIRIDVHDRQLALSGHGQFHRVDQSGVAVLRKIRRMEDSLKGECRG
jgi:hypothetical protein